MSAEVHYGGLIAQLLSLSPPCRIFARFTLTKSLLSVLFVLTHCAPYLKQTNKPIPNISPPNI